MKARLHFVVAIIVVTVITGCAVGPDYHPPQTNFPKHFGEGDANCIQPAVAQTSVASSGHASLISWWTCFGDDELNSLVTRALDANHELKIAAARVREARDVERIAKSELFPTVDFSAAFGKAQGSAAGFGFPYGAPGTGTNLYQLGFDATYEVDLFGGVRRTIEAAGASAEASEDERRGVQVSLLGEVAREYVGLRTIQRRRAIALQNLDDQRRTLNIVEKRVRNGLSAKFDLVRARAQVDATESGIPPLEAGIRQTIYALSVLLGQEPLALSSELSAASPIPPVPPVMPLGLPSDLLKRRPDVMGAERMLAAATATQGVATSDLFPHLILGGTAGVQSLRVENLFRQHTPSSGFYLAGPTADWTIFDGGRRGANLDRAKAQITAALATYESTVLRALQEVDSGLNAYSHDQARRDSLATLVADSQEAVRIAQGEYSNGLIDLLDVLEVQRTLYTAQDALAQSDQAVASNLVALYKALGGGWETPKS